MLIGFSKLNSKLLILAIFPIFEPIRKIFDEIRKERKDKFKDNNYFKLFRFYLSYVLSIIF